MANLDSRDCEMPVLTDSRICAPRSAAKAWFSAWDARECIYSVATMRPRMYASRQKRKRCNGASNYRDLRMPAHSGPLIATAPKKRNPEFSDGSWAFPKRLEELAAKHGWDQQQVAEIASVSQGTVSRWMAYKVREPNREAVRRLELKGGIPAGELTKEPGDGLESAPSVVLRELRSWCDRLGINDTVVSTLTDEKLGGRVQRFRLEVRQAILGLVHVYGVNLERAADIADEVLQEHPRMARSSDADALFWFTRMTLKVSGKKESGKYPSVGSIKV